MPPSAQKTTPARGRADSGHFSRSRRSQFIPQLLRRVRGLIILLLFCFIVFLLVGPQLPIPRLQTFSLKVRTNLTTLVQDQIVNPIRERLSQIEINNPLQTASDQRFDEYNRAVEAVTGEEPVEEETCIALFGTIPLNCPDPTGEGMITADRPGEVPLEECVAVFGLTPIECEAITQ